MINQKEVKKARQNAIKYPSVSRPVFCRDCLDSRIHETGSLLWVSCRFVSGWRSINSECCLPLEEQKRRGEQSK